MIKIFSIALISFLCVQSLANDDDQDPNTSLGYEPGNEQSSQFLDPTTQNQIIAHVTGQILERQNLNYQNHLTDRVGFLLAQLATNTRFHGETFEIFEELAQLATPEEMQIPVHTLFGLFENTIDAGFETLFHAGIRELRLVHENLTDAIMTEIYTMFLANIQAGQVGLMIDQAQLQTLFIRLYREARTAQLVRSTVAYGIEPLLRAGHSITHEQRNQMITWFYEDLQAGTITLTENRELIARFQDYYRRMQPVRSPVLEWNLFETEFSRSPSPISTSSSRSSSR